MTIKDAEKLARKLIKRHLGTRWQFQWDGAVRRAGACHYDRNVISLSRRLTELNNEAHARNTILHEIAHALAPPEESPHGDTWKRIARYIGCNGERCHNAPTPPTKYVTFRKVCGKVGERHRVGERSCGSCSPIGLAGRRVFSPKFLIIVRTRAEVEAAGGIEMYKAKWAEDNGVVWRADLHSFISRPSKAGEGRAH